VSVLVCVPVYNGFDSVSRCLDALASARVAAPFRTLLINDASPDERIRPLLDRYALAHADTQVRHNAINRGFTWNVNQAFIAARADEPLCLLNSDTLVTDGWLDAMLECLADDASIGTITPFSNNATICSFPDFTRAWPVPEHAERERIARALRQSPAAAIDLPTGVGFCMRAAVAGFRNVLCPNAYVAHEGGVSFSEATQALMKAGAERLLAKHPSYDAEVVAWIAADPAQSRRAQVSAILAQR